MCRDVVVHIHIDDADRCCLLGRARCLLALTDATLTNLAFMGSAAMGSFAIESTTDRDWTWPRDGQTALLVWAENPDAVATAPRRAVSDDEFIDLSTAANDRVSERRFDPEAVGAEILALQPRLSAIAIGCQLSVIDFR